MKLQESKLIFVPSHNDFDKEGIVATKEMLDYGPYPFLSYSNKNIDYDTTRVFKNALNALTKLHPFTAKASIIVDENKCLRVPKRIWAIIYYQKEPIFHITHDTRFNNVAYTGIFDWAQLRNYGSDTSYEGEDAEAKKVIDFSSEENWELLIRNRIKDKANDLIVKSQVEITQAQVEITNAQKLLNALI